jgi:hypothetical protein
MPAPAQITRKVPEGPERFWEHGLDYESSNRTHKLRLVESSVTCLTSQIQENLLVLSHLLASQATDR